MDNLLLETAWLGKSQATKDTLPVKPALRPLHCPKCDTPLPAGEREVAYLCQGCGWGLELTTEGLRRIESSFAAPEPHPRVKGALHLPFWVFDATVRVRKRSAIKKHLLGIRRPSTDHGEFWRETRRFYMPAFDARLENLRAWGVDLTRRQPNLTPGELRPLKNCVYTEAEARELVELIFLGIEFDKPDIIQEIDYSLTLASPRLLVIPFVEEPR